jgi:hypothetical protein
MAPILSKGQALTKRLPEHSRFLVSARRSVALSYSFLDIAFTPLPGADQDGIPNKRSVLSIGPRMLDKWPAGWNGAPHQF